MNLSEYTIDANIRESMSNAYRTLLLTKMTYHKQAPNLEEPAKFHMNQDSAPQAYLPLLRFCQLKSICATFLKQIVLQILFESFSSFPFHE